MQSALDFIRYAVFVVFMVALIAAVASWLVRTRRVSPFSQLGRSLKTASDPLITPVERRLVRGGGNPVHAGTWLVVGVAIAGLLLIFGLDWATSFFEQAYWSFTHGFKPLYRFLVDFTYKVLMFALLARVIGSWFGVFRYARWMRVVYFLTDWIVNPIRKFLPPVGALDVSPIVAWLALYLVMKFLLTVVPV